MCGASNRQDREVQLEFQAFVNMLGQMSTLRRQRFLSELGFYIAQSARSAHPSGELIAKGDQVLYGSEPLQERTVESRHATVPFGCVATVWDVLIVQRDRYGLFQLSDR